MTSYLDTRAKEIIEQVTYANIASATSSAIPWNTPVFAAYDEEYIFYWSSDKNAQHSQNIRENKKIFLTIYDTQAPKGKGDGVYIEADGYELVTDKEIENALSFLDKRAKRKASNVKDFMQESPLRIYKAITLKVYISTPETAEHYHGQWLSKRVELNLV